MLGGGGLEGLGWWWCGSGALLGSEGSSVVSLCVGGVVVGFSVGRICCELSLCVWWGWAWVGVCLWWCFENFTVDASIFVSCFDKFFRAHGGCLGIESR